QEQAQAADATRLEQEAKTTMQQRYIASGGTSNNFEKAWPAIWQEELVRRTLASGDPQLEKLRQSGRYAS
ncbi:MAG: hypothetical protein H0U76_14480, partial [Ktedonobacteraceae bacterium]|nr:hypothetical protein [Ktedonobacteraceae bacterium]